MPHDAADHPGPEPRSEARPPRRAAGTSLFHIYKPSQGTYVRWCSAIGAAIIAVAGVNFVNEQLARFAFEPQTLLIVRTVVSVGLLVGLGYLLFWLTAQHRGVVDFLIATEGEVKKVNWSTRKEVIGATKVVIFTVLVLGFLLFFVDLFFIVFFSAIDVLRVDVLSNLLGGGSGT